MPDNTPQQFIGAIVEAGTGEDNLCAVTIVTTPEQLRQLTWLPMYQDVLVFFAPLPDKTA